MRVHITGAAKADLADIGDYIAKDSPIRADSFVEELLQAAFALGAFPKAYPLVPRYERHGIRRRPYGNYLIFYTIEDDQLSVVHILHGAQDYEALLFPDS